MSPYYINEPAAISFSGGRTSAYMLYRILEAHNGKLPDYVKVLFANTGKEMPQTLDFVHACEVNWGVDIQWLELVAIERVINDNSRNSVNRAFKVTNYEHASRNGEPFNALLEGFDAISNAVARTCTVNLKIRPMAMYLKEMGYESPWVQYIGIRADEERRARKLHGVISEGHEAFLPLYLDGVTAKQVGDFWKANDFDLALPNNNGITDWGNCDLCFLKGKAKRAAIIRERPDLADWWIKAEEKKQQQFRPDEPSYRQMRDYALNQMDMFEGIIDDSIPCFCGD